MFGRAGKVLAVVITNQQSLLEIISAFPYVKIPLRIFSTAMSPCLQP
jgi:hypothetical protein